MSLISGINKKIKNNSKVYWLLREVYVVVFSFVFRIFDKKTPNKKKRILFYHINSIGYAGTEKLIQIIAKYLDKNRYDVFFLYPNKVDENKELKSRLEYIRDGGVITIPFDIKNVSSSPPYFVFGMNPDIKKFIKTFNIDLLIVPGAGNADYPFSCINNIPIILFNIFGQPNIQENIKYHICISQEVANKLIPIVPENKIRVFPVPSEGPTKDSIASGREIRNKFNIKDSDFVFGRVGRPDNAIFDPIGIEAFKIVVKKYPSAHYIIMAPAPVLIEKVKNENIPNVYFLDSSSNEGDVWAFHQSIDALAHFRSDGESFGLNIVESMLCGKPIITHKSNIWNAHLEYLDQTFSRVSEVGDVKTYAKHMEEFILLKQDDKIKEFGLRAKEKANFVLIENNIKKIEVIISESLK